MVGLIIETPLAKNDIGAGVLNSGDHIGEVVGLHLDKTFVIGGALDLKTVLGLRLGRLEWAGEDAHLGVSVNFLHLGVGEFLVDDNTLDEAGVLEGATSLGNDLDEVEVDITSLHVGDVKDSLDSEVGVVLLALADDLGAEGGLGAHSQLCVVVLGDVELLLDLGDSADSDVTSSLETISDLEWVDTLLEELHGLVEDGASEDDNTGGSVTDFVVLGSGKLSQESGSLMMDLLEANSKK